MTEIIDKNIYYVFTIITYLIIAIFSANHLSLMKYIFNSVIARTIAYKFKSNPLLNIFRKIKSASFNINNIVIKPFAKISIILLNKLSMILNTSEEKVSDYLSKSFIEVITESGFIIRKIVNAENQYLWQFIIVVYIIIYFILTI